MKIGILTLPLHGNYGGNLQAYALMRVLKEMGHDPCLISRKSKPFPKWRVLPALLKRSLRRYVFGDRKVSVTAGIIDGAERARIEKHSRAFIAQYIQPRTRIFTSTRDMEIGIAEYGFDAIVVGSDQVWRPSYAPAIAENFLSFLPPNCATKRISYAASFGTDDWLFSEQEHRECAAAISLFDGISVREASAVDVCRARFGVRAQHVLDPTMLLDSDDYASLLADWHPASSESQPTAHVYVLDEDAQRASIVEAVCRDLELSPSRANAVGPDGSALAVEGWLAGFRDSKFVITDSFHACAFAILFKKPFIAYGNRKRGLARFESLLGMFGLLDRLVVDSEGYNANIARAEIDWSTVDRILNERRGEAMKFIEDALRGKDTQDDDA